MKTDNVVASNKVKYIEDKRNNKKFQHPRSFLLLLILVQGQIFA